MATPLDQLLEKYNACDEARNWALNYKTLPEAWAACERGDWMLWLAARAELCTRSELVLAACACARLALPYARGKAARVCIETAEAWAREEATLRQVRDAADAAYAAADDAAAYAAATAAAYTAAATDADADADAYAATAADAAARAAILKNSADIVRKRINARGQKGGE